MSTTVVALSVCKQEFQVTPFLPIPDPSFFLFPVFRFGPSLSEITNFGANFGDPTEATTFKSWIIDQIETVPLSSHREFYRRHTNPRWDRVSQSARSLPSPCNKFARWRTVPLTSRDYALKTLVVEQYRDTGKFMLKVNDEFRTLVDNIEVEDSEGLAVIVPGNEYPLCNPGREFWQEAVVS